jgi:hypothetical protein
VRTENCPPGFKTGDQISPPGGYVGGGLQLQTDIAVGPAGDVWAFLVSTAALLAATPAHAELSAEELAKLAQNPVGNLISVPFQNNTNLNVGPDKGRRTSSTSSR